MAWTDNDSEDFVGKATSPFDFKYMKFLRVILRIISGWPGKELGEKLLRLERNGYAVYNTILSFVYFILGIWYLKDHIKHLTFMELGHMYIVLLLNMLTSSRCVTLCISKKYPVVAFVFIKEIHLVHHKNKSKFANRIFREVHKMSNFFTVYMFSVTIIALFLFNLTPVYNNYASGKYDTTKGLVNTTYEHAIYFKYPFNAYTSFEGYMVASVINWYGSYLCATGITMFDLFLSLMVFNLWGHFKILLNNLATFPRPAAESNPSVSTIYGSEQYSESEQAEVAARLKECVIYHRFITSSPLEGKLSTLNAPCTNETQQHGEKDISLVCIVFTHQMSDAFGMALFVYFMFHQVSGCLLLLECSQMSTEALIRYLPLTVVMFQQLIQVSVIFETIGAMSEKLKYAVYDLPWEYMNSKNRSTLQILLINVQKPIHVTAGGMVAVGVTTMASILKTSITYFAFLRTVGPE